METLLCTFNYVDTLVSRHVGIVSHIIQSGTSAHQQAKNNCANMPTSRAPDAFVPITTNDVLSLLE